MTYLGADRLLYLFSALLSTAAFAAALVLLLLLLFILGIYVRNCNTTVPVGKSRAGWLALRFVSPRPSMLPLAKVVGKQSSLFFGMSRNAHPKETAAHNRTTFLSIIWPITAFVPFSSCYFKLVQSETTFYLPITWGDNRRQRRLVKRVSFSRIPDSKLRA